MKDGNCPYTDKNQKTKCVDKCAICLTDSVIRQAENP